MILTVTDIVVNGQNYNDSFIDSTIEGALKTVFEIVDLLNCNVEEKGDLTLVVKDEHKATKIKSTMVFKEISAKELAMSIIITEKKRHLSKG
jgi:C4-type Zn-finger protein